MTPYASRTGTRTTLDVLRRSGWRLMLSPAGVMRDEGFRYALDNGAWSAYQQGKRWDAAPFEKALDTHGDAADFIVLPDIVAGGMESLRLSLEWLNRLQGRFPLILLAVQDGMEPGDVLPHIGSGVGIFVGGSTEWKWDTLGQWAALPTYCHVGRVNTERAIKRCSFADVDSYDGSGASRWTAYARSMTKWHLTESQQGRLF